MCWVIQCGLGGGSSTSRDGQRGKVNPHWKLQKRLHLPLPPNWHNFPLNPLNPHFDPPLGKKCIGHTGVNCSYYLLLYIYTYSWTVTCYNEEIFCSTGESCSKDVVFYKAEIQPSEALRNIQTCSKIVKSIIVFNSKTGLFWIWIYTLLGSNILRESSVTGMLTSLVVIVLFIYLFIYFFYFF